MIVKRIYNNNIILADDHEGKEVVLLGRGIGFGLSKGDWINKEKIEKKFALDEAENYKFQELIKDVPIDLISLSDDIISFIKEKIDEPLNDSIYTTLTDHISNLSSRLKNGSLFDNTFLWNISQLYSKEYEVAKQVLTLIEEHLDLTIDKEEANYITLHIVNAETNTRFMEIYTITEIVDYLNSEVEVMYPDIDKDAYAFQRFLVHCRWFAHRVVKEIKLQHKSKKNEELYKVLTTQYPIANECIETISNTIEKKYNYNVNTDEKLYLILHLIRVTE